MWPHLSCKESQKNKCLIILASIVRGSPYLCELRRLKSWGGPGYKKKVQMLETQKERKSSLHCEQQNDWQSGHLLLSISSIFSPSVFFSRFFFPNDFQYWNYSRYTWHLILCPVQWRKLQLLIQEGLKCVYKYIFLSLVMRPISEQEKESKHF